MELIKKIYQTPRNWVDIDHDLSKLKSTDVAGKIGMKLVDLLVRHDRPQLLQKLFSKAKKIDVSFIDRYGRTVLHNAVANRSVKTLHILLENGAKPQINKRDRFWFFGPLHFAVINNDASSIKELIRYGADVNLKADFTDLKKTDIDNTGWLKSPNRIRPIHLASITGRLNIIKILIAHGARVNSHAERDGITSLFMAAIEYSNKETPDRKRTQLLATINYLISKGAKIGSVNYDGESILYYKSIWENDELFDIFVDGIDVNIINYNKDTVLHNRLLLNTLPQTKKEIAKQRRILKKMDSFYINYPNVFYYDTILHLYAKNGLWKQLENVLSTKYLDIYAMNKEGDRPIDFIAKRDRQRFFKMVAAGYHWCLQHCPHVKPITTWEKICKKLKSTDKDIKTLQRLSGHTHCINVDSLCELVASRMIAKSKKSYPTLAKMDINLSVKGKFKNNWWSATAFEIFFGLLYLAKKYSAKKVCFRIFFVILKDIIAPRKAKFMNIIFKNIVN